MSKERTWLLHFSNILYNGLALLSSFHCMLANAIFISSFFFFFFSQNLRENLFLRLFFQSRISKRRSGTYLISFFFSFIVLLSPWILDFYSLLFALLYHSSFIRSIRITTSFSLIYTHAASFSLFRAIDLIRGFCVVILFFFFFFSVSICYPGGLY